MSVKAATLAAITQDAWVPLWRSFVSDQVIVLMLHRFADAERKVSGDSPDALRANLEFLRRHEFHLASLNDLMREDRAHVPRGGPTVVFTVDDGYADFARIAAPIFSEFDCPVTVFVVTDAVEGKCWFWWDRVTYAIESSRRDDIALDLSTGRVQARRSEGGAATTRITEALKQVPDAEKEDALARLAAHMDVAIDAAPPDRYASMSWSDIHRCAQRGVTFGPHTVRHPMLTKVDATRAASEMLDSWGRLRERCDATVPVFCYPNGWYAPEHIAVLAKSEMRTALTTHPDYATGAMFTSPDPAVRYTIPRFAYVGAREPFVQVVAGVERVKNGVRQVLRRLRAG
jgi:peptidoglycan/xylan/chitin deacetylase (PgdA/CDA1 family)